MLKQFEQHLTADDKSPKTLESYLGDVRSFIQYLERNGASGTRFQRAHVTAYRRHLIERGFKEATINKKINSIYAYNVFLKEAGVMEEIVVVPRRDRVRVAAGSEREVEVFTGGEVERIISNINNQSARSRLIIHLLLYTGIRVSELVSIKLADMDLLTGSVTVRGKGGKIREVPLKPEVTELIREYMKTERNKSRHNQSEYLLLSQRSGKCHRDAVNRMLRRLSSELGFKLYPHKFRHTFCSRLVKKGAPLSTVAMLAGHANVQAIAHYYVNTSREDKRAAVSLL